MAGAKQFKPKEDLLFEGRKLDCKKERLNDDVFVYGGYWKCEEFENKVAVKGREQLKMINVKKEAAIRQIENEECCDGWKDTADQLIKLNHHNILRLFGYEEDVANGLRYFALEPHSATLFHYCNDTYEGPMPNESQVLYQITNGINYLHGKGIIHGELNPLSVVIAAQSRPVRIKIADSGLSTKSYGKQLKESRSFFYQSESETQWKQIYQMSKHVADDTVAAGCILFYYLNHGDHLFGDDSVSILKNLKDKNPVNLKRLDKTHVAYELIKNMVIPPSKGLNWLHIGNEQFKEALSLQVNTNKPLGNGSFGNVYEGKFNGDPVAVKQMTTTTSEKEFIQREMNKHIELDHVNVVKLFDITDSADNIFTYCAIAISFLFQNSIHFIEVNDLLKTSDRHLVLELCAGTLTDYCEKKYNGPKLPPDELVLYQIANGLHYIHSRNLVHRDIKPDNILISMTTPVQMKVSDLSFVKKTRTDMFSQSNIRGTIQWMAPERLTFLNDPDNMPTVLPDGTIKSDTFSSGCVFFYFLTRGLHPFGNNVTAPTNIVNNRPVEFVNYMKSPTKSNKIGSYADLIYGMIKGNEKERTGLPDVIEQLANLLSRMDKIKCRLCHVKVPLEKVVYYVSAFHPTKLILACASENELVFSTAENSSIPFSNWRKQVQLLPQDVNMGTDIELDWNMNGTQLATGYDCRTLIVWNYPECKILFQKKNSSFTEIRWNPTRPNVLATFSKDKENVFLWDSSIGGVITTIGSERVRAVNWICANRIAVYSADSYDVGFINIFEMDKSHSTTTTRVVKQFKHGEECGRQMEWNERTQYLASYGDHEMKIWSMDSDEPIYCLEAAEMCITTFAWRPRARNGKQVDGSEMARKSPEYFDIVYVLAEKGSYDGSRLYIWNPLKPDQKPQLLYDEHQIDNITFSPDGRFLASQSEDKLIIWSPEDWKPIDNNSQTGAGAGVSWLISTTSTNIHEKKLINRLWSHEAKVFEFVFDYEENEISDSAISVTPIKSQEENLNSNAASKTSIESEDMDANDDNVSPLKRLTIHSS